MWWYVLVVPATWEIEARESFYHYLFHEFETLYCQKIFLFTNYSPPSVYKYYDYKHELPYPTMNFFIKLESKRT
jgi:hypothetical protein